MSGRPYFTIAIPTKNRPDRVENAVRSVLAQTFDDLEVVVCDNSDPGVDETGERLRVFDDPRLRYIRTAGTLSMPDNWETAVADARGEYVGVLTDRSVYRRDALNVAHSEIERTDARCVAWFNDLYGRDATGTALKRRACTLRRHRLERERVLDYFLNGDPKYSTKIVPKLMTGVFHRSILEAACASPVGRCCPPVCPDYTSGFLMLAHCDGVQLVDEALYVSCGFGNGSAFRRRSELGNEFRQDLGMTWAEMVDRMPSEACFSHALVLNDLMRLRDLIPERFPTLEINRKQYYLGCMNDYVKTARGSIKRDDDLAVLLSALEREPQELQAAVRSTQIYGKAEQFSSPTLRSDTTEKLAATVYRKVHKSDEVLGFTDVFAALEWDAANPRVPAEQGFLDVLPTIDQVKRRKLASTERKGSRWRAHDFREALRGRARRRPLVTKNL